MNKANKTVAQAKTMMNYLNSDRRFLVPNIRRTRFVKRTVTRMMRRVNKAMCAE